MFFEPDQPRADVMNVGRTNGIGQIVDRKQPAISLERPCCHSRVAGNSTGFPDVNMRGRGTKQLVAGPGVHANGNLIGHGSRGNIDGRFLAQKLGRAGLEHLDRRVVAEDVVANLGLGHGPAHCRRWPCHGVRSQVNGRSIHERILAFETTPEVTPSGRHFSTGYCSRTEPGRSTRCRLGQAPVLDRSTADCPNLLAEIDWNPPERRRRDFSVQRREP